jgi:hypothetical protein
VAGLGTAENIAELRKMYAKVKSGWSADTRFMAQAAMFNSERIERIATLMEKQLQVAQKAAAKPKRKPSEWQKFFAAGMKAGKTPTEIGEMWRNR